MCIRDRSVYSECARICSSCLTSARNGTGVGSVAGCSVAWLVIPQPPSGLFSSVFVTVLIIAKDRHFGKWVGGLQVFLRGLRGPAPRVCGARGLRGPAPRVWRSGPARPRTLQPARDACGAYAAPYPAARGRRRPLASPRWGVAPDPLFEAVVCAQSCAHAFGQPERLLAIRHVPSYACRHTQRLNRLHRA